MTSISLCYQKVRETWFHNNHISFAGKKKGLGGGSSNTWKMICNRFVFELRCLKIGQLLGQVSRGCDFPPAPFLSQSSRIWLLRGNAWRHCSAYPPSGEHTGHPHSICCCPKAHLSSLLLLGRLTFNNAKAPACCSTKLRTYLSSNTNYSAQNS